MLSTKTRKITEVALANRVAAKELCDAIDVGGNPVAADVPVIPASADLTVPAVTAATVADTDITATQLAVVASDLNAALDLKADNSVMVTVVGEVEARVDALEAKVNAIITALKAAGLMA